jgi:hypothetical protein
VVIGTKFSTLCGTNNEGTAGGFDNIITGHIQVINTEDSFDLHEQPMQQSEITTCNARNCGNGFHAKSYTADDHQELFKLFVLTHVKIERHIKIRAEATLYDSAYVAYFAKRKIRPEKWNECWYPV